MSRKFHKNKRRPSNKSIAAFILVVLPPFIFYIINYFGNNLLLVYMGGNLIIQTFYIFLACVALVGLFSPITFRKEITEIKVKQIINKERKESLEIEKLNKKIEAGACL